MARMKLVVGGTDSCFLEVMSLNLTREQQNIEVFKIFKHDKC